jgi:hypothetical protein
MSLADEFEIPIKCPKCGETSKRSLAELESQPVVTCSCGARITVRGADEPAAAMKQLDDALKGFRRKR